MDRNLAAFNNPELRNHFVIGAEDLKFMDEDGESSNSRIERLLQVDDVEWWTIHILASINYRLDQHGASLGDQLVQVNLEFDFE